MDAGLAAVLGAVAGSLATTGAAFATGWAAREQARIAARAEDRRQRREPRNDTYKRFIDAAREMEHHTQLDPPLVARPEDDLDVSQYPAVVARAAHRVREAWIDVALVGPPEVERIACDIERSSKACAELVRAHTSASFFLVPTRHTPEELPGLLADFITAAREALADDGTGNRK